MSLYLWKNGVVNSYINNFFVQGLSGFQSFFPINFVLDLKNGNILNRNNIIIESSDNFLTEPIEPTYTYTSNVLENGNVELTFTFEDYDDSNSPYAFTIENEVSGEKNMGKKIIFLQYSQRLYLMVIVIQ